MAGFFEPRWSSSASRNSRCIRSTIFAMAWADLSRSALPKRIPLMPQFGSSRDFGVSRRITTPTKDSQPASDFLTASAIADCKRSRETELRLSDDRCFGSHDNIRTWKIWLFQTHGYNAWFSRYKAAAVPAPFDRAFWPQPIAAFGLNLTIYQMVMTLPAAPMANDCGGGFKPGR